MNAETIAEPQLTRRSFSPSWHSPLVLIAVLLVGLALRLHFASMPGYPGDIDGWSRMSSLVVRFGYAHIYDPGIFNRDQGVYPPLYHVMLNGVGLVYKQFYSPTFELQTEALNLLLKLFPILCECILGLSLYRGLRRTASDRTALLSTAVFMLNPAILYNTAYWGMFGDAFYTLCLVIALFAFQREKMFLAACAIGAGVLFKFQTVAFLPLLLVWSVRPFHWRRTLAFVAGFGVTAAIIWAPFVLAGTLPYALRALRNTVGLFPVLSANAHNLWWLLNNGDTWTTDLQRVLGSLSARTVGLLAFGAANLLVLFRSTDHFNRFASAAYIGFAFFMLCTEMHENYLYPTVALLMILWLTSSRYMLLVLIITITALANMALHDVLTDPSSWLPADSVDSARLLNSALNALVFVIWTLMLVWENRRDWRLSTFEYGKQRVSRQ